MHLDGTAIKTCVLPVAAAADKAVTTIEGLGNPEDLHPLQTAWIEHNVPQCGYCQSGQIMAAAALIADKPSASSEDVDNAMSGNICRCGCYPRIKAAIMSVAASALSYDAAAAEANS
jgi:isoquinoline 1-oxidoreductase alpha subunit